MAKVWKAYIKKHGEPPEDETDLVVFSKKSRKLQTLTLKQALRIYNKNKTNDVAQKKSSKKKKRQTKATNGSNSKKRSARESNTNTRKNTKTKRKNGKKDITRSSKKETRSSKKDAKSSKKQKTKRVAKIDKNKSSKPDPKDKKKKKPNKAVKLIKNLSPSKVQKKRRKHRRTSTDEHMKHNLYKEKTKTETHIPPPLHEDNTNTDDIIKDTTHDASDDSDAKEIAPQDEAHEEIATTNTEDVKQKEAVEAPSLTPVEAEESGVSTKSPQMSSALAMFQNLSSPKASDLSLNPVTSPKVKKKGKRYFEFREFASGAFSVVYKAKDRENNDCRVAIKKIHIGGSLHDGKYEATTKEEGDNEVRILKLMNDHCNTCAMIDTYFDMQLGVNSGYVLCIVMEYMQSTLKEEIEMYGEEGDAIPPHLIKIYSFQIVRAIEYLHIKNVCHRDIKPENILVNAATNKIQLCDFGCSLVLGVNAYNADEEYKYETSEDGYEPYVMSRFYRAPECILGNRYYSCDADKWSLGVVMSEMFLGMILFMGSANKDQLKEIIIKLGWPTKQQLLDMNPNIKTFDTIDGVYGLDKENALGESWSMIFCGVFDMEDDAIDVISQLLQYSPQKRISLLDCLRHDYFEDLKDLMHKSIKKKKANKKIKKQDVVPPDLFDWNETEIRYAKAMGVELP
eukprot:484401_1